MKKIFIRAGQNAALPWVVLFFLLNLTVTQDGGLNARSRIATLRATVEQKTFSIDNYTDWTQDWSLSPNGHYYSNKAPGPALLGWPFFAIVDFPLHWLSRRPLDEKGRLNEPGYAELLWLNLCTQLLPFAFLVLLITERIEAAGRPRHAQHFFALAALLGNTAALYMNCYFGHGLAAAAFLAGFFAWWERRYALSSFFIACAVLSDYGTIFCLPFFVGATVWREKWNRPALPVLYGCLAPAALWVWYHTSAFGSPFRLASQFINSTQVYALPGSSSTAFSFLPSGEVLGELLFGSARGILFTQPWVFAGIALLPFFRREERPAVFFLLGSLAGLLWMNAGFGGWHGGYTLGPRYLAVVFPALALLWALGLARAPRAVRGLLYAGLAIAVAFRFLTFPFSNLAPVENLWRFHLHLFLEAKKYTPAFRFALGLLFGLACWAWARRRERQRERQKQLRPRPFTPCSQG